MNFDTVVEYRINKIREILSLKAEEYATASDRFHNFRVGGDKWMFFGTGA
jgi:hypothetical protein